MIPDEAVTVFWAEYWERARVLAPGLQMRRPDTKPAKSSFVWFHPARLPSEIDLIHKVAHGNVDLQFSGLAERMAEFADRYASLLDDDMVIAQAGKSVSVRIQVPEIRHYAPLEESAGAVEMGLRAAQRLLDWYVRHRPEMLEE